MSMKRCVWLIMASDQPSLNRSYGLSKVTFFSRPFLSTTVNSAVSDEGSFHSAIFLYLTQHLATERSQVVVDNDLASFSFFFALMMFDLTSRRNNLHIYTDLLANIDDHAGSILGSPLSWFGEACDLYVVSPTVLFKGIDLPLLALHLTFDVAHIFFYGLQACL